MKIEVEDTFPMKIEVEDTFPRRTCTQRIGRFSPDGVAHNSTIVSPSRISSASFDTGFVPGVSPHFGASGNPCFASHSPKSPSVSLEYSPILVPSSSCILVTSFGKGRSESCFNIFEVPEVLASVFGNGWRQPQPLCLVSN